MREIRSRFPAFRSAVFADAVITAQFRGERGEFRSRGDAIFQALRLCLVSDGFLGLVFYRLKASLQARGVPFLPRIAHRLAMMTSQIAIGDPVVMHPGVYMAHGQTVIDGLTEIGTGVVIAPWTSIGLRSGSFHGPTIGAGAHVGTGARVLGPVTIGAGAQIGANAVVIDDVEAGAVAVGVPARSIPS